MDNLFMGNVVPPPSSGTSLPEMLSSVLRQPVPLRDESRPCGNRSEIDPDHGSDKSPKTDRLEIGIGDRLHPGIVIGLISEC